MYTECCASLLEAYECDMEPFYANGVQLYGYTELMIEMVPLNYSANKLLR